MYAYACAHACMFCVRVCLLDVAGTDWVRFVNKSEGKSCHSPLRAPLHMQCHELQHVKIKRRLREVSQADQPDSLAESLHVNLNLERGVRGNGDVMDLAHHNLPVCTSRRTCKTLCIHAY